jgi:ADP-ribose pyrophosphatase YjhB (NUDIX family)
MRDGFIEREKYDEISNLIPIACLDLAIIYNDRCLLVKRAEFPEKDKWYFAGGRILKGKTIEQCAVQIAKQETNLNCRFVKVCETHDYFCEQFHEIVLGCLLFAENDRVKLDETSYDYIWTGNIKKLLAEYVSQDFVSIIDTKIKVLECREVESI